MIYKNVVTERVTKLKKNKNGNRKQKREQEENTKNTAKADEKHFEGRRKTLQRQTKNEENRCGEINTDENELVKYFMKIGFTENESKAYISLVKLNEANARELHEYTGIPRAKTYEVLSGLVGKGYVQIRHGSPTYYRAAEPQELIRRLKREYMDIFETIGESIEELHCEKDESSPIWYLKSEWPIMKRGKRLIAETKKDLIIVSNDPSGLNLFKDDIKKISKKINVTIFADETEPYTDFGAPVFKKEMKYRKYFRTMIEKEIGDAQDESELSDRKKVILISDASTALIIENKSGKTEGVYLTDYLVRIIHQSIIFMHENMENLSDDGDTIKIVIRKPKKNTGNKTENKSRNRPGCGSMTR